MAAAARTIVERILAEGFLVCWKTYYYYLRDFGLKRVWLSERLLGMGLGEKLKRPEAEEKLEKR